MKQAINLYSALAERCHNKKRLNWLWSLLFLIFLSGKSLAADFSLLYPPDQLIKAQETYIKSIQTLLFQDIRPYLSINEWQTLSKTKVNLPLQSNKYDLFNYSTNLTSGKIIIPTLSIKFFDDLSVAFSWYEHYQLDKREIINYITKIYESNHPPIPPLLALGIPENAREINVIVNTDAQKTLKSALIFLILHNLGHCHFHHTQYSIISNQRIQLQEKQADEFALEVMARMHILPQGMVHWFTVTALLANQHTVKHPISPDRLYDIAKWLKSNSKKFFHAKSETHPATNEVQAVALNISMIASQLKTVK